MCGKLGRARSIITIVVWKKITIGYFHVKIICGKIFSSYVVSKKNFIQKKFLNNKLFLRSNFLFRCS